VKYLAICCSNLYIYRDHLVTICYMLDLLVWKIYLHSDAVISITIKQACLLWQLPFLQHVLTVVIQQSRYPIIEDRNTLILLSFLWQSSSILLLSVSHHWNLCIRVVKLRLEYFSISFILLYFSFLSFYFYLLNLGLGFSMTSLTHCHISHNTVTSHIVVIERYKRFWKNDVIQYV